MVPLKNLVVRVATDLQSPIHKPLVQRRVDADERDIGVLCLKDRFQTIELLLLFSQQIDLVAVLDMLFEVLCQDVELLMEDRLGNRIKRHLRVLRERTLLVQLDGLSVF